jgi:RNA polymerase sigma-70 factor (ECF subfamily)
MSPPALASFREMYDANVAFVWRAMRRLGVSESDTPDAVQEVFLVAHRRMADFEGRSKASTWLFGIAFRVASDRRKRADFRRQVLDDDAIGAAPDDDADGRHLDDRLHAAAVLERAIQALPLEQRAVFVLYELEEHTSAEIAEAMSTPIGTVHSRLRLAREAFQTTATRLMRGTSGPLRKKASR